MHCSRACFIPGTPCSPDSSLLSSFQSKSSPFFDCSPLVNFFKHPFNVAFTRSSTVHIVATSSFGKGSGKESGKGPGSGGKNDPEEIGKIICRSVEIQFRLAWAALYSQGVGEAYINTLKKFIDSVMIAYRKGYSLLALQLELSSNEITTGDPKADEFIKLSPQEKEARAMWFKLIYLTLEKLHYSKRTAPPPLDVDPSLHDFVQEIVDAKRKGFNFMSYKMEKKMMETGQPQDISPAEASVRSQYTRIVFLTCEQVGSS